MKSDIVEVKKEAQTLTDQKMVLKGTFVEENVDLIDDVMVASQDSSDKCIPTFVEDDVALIDIVDVMASNDFLNKPPFFKGEGYSYQKEKMENLIRKRKWNI